MVGANLIRAPHPCSAGPRLQKSKTKESVSRQRFPASSDRSVVVRTPCWRSSVRRCLPRARALDSSDAKGAAAQSNPFEEKVVHVDNWLDRTMISLFANKMADQLEGFARPRNPSFEDFVDVSREIVKGRTSQQQQEVVGRVLDSLLPPRADLMFRTLMPFAKWSAELNAWITKAGFKWLVGPMEIQEADVEFGGRTEKWRSQVKITKCRYLENSGCVGMCTNMCKLPTQAFFTDTFGIPLVMEPNFEDLSCTCTFGRIPAPITADPVYEQPCFRTECPLAVQSGPCPKIDSDRQRKPRDSDAVQEE